MTTTKVPHAASVVDLAQRRSARDARRQTSFISPAHPQVEDACVELIRGLGNEDEILELRTAAWLLKISRDAAKELFDSIRVPGAFRVDGTWRIRAGDLSDFVCAFTERRIDPNTSFRLHGMRITQLMTKLWPDQEHRDLPPEGGLWEPSPESASVGNDGLCGVIDLAARRSERAVQRSSRDVIAANLTRCSELSAAVSARS